jgi:hypothetical protein
MDEFFVGIVGAIVVFFVIGFGLFLLLRELMCWYYKINRIVSLLESIDSKLAYYGQRQTTGGSTVTSVGSAVASVSSANEICPFCKELSLKANAICEVCGKQKR